MLKFKLVPPPPDSSPAAPNIPVTPLQKKRRHENDENLPPGDATPATPSNKKKQKKTHSNKPLSTSALPSSPFSSPFQFATGRHHFKPSQKMDIVLDALEYAHWGFAEMLGYAFDLAVARTPRHAGAVSGFLRGEAKVTPAQILHAWDRSADGRIEREENMYSLDIHYSQIKPVRPALTSYAAQKCLEKISREAGAAVKPDAGLHATARKDPKNADTKLEWQQIGTSTVQSVEEVVKSVMPISFSFAMKIAGDGPDLPKPPQPSSALKLVGAQSTATEGGQTVDGVDAMAVIKGSTLEAQQGSVLSGVTEEGVPAGKVVAKKTSVVTRRPANLVATHAIASLLYKRNSEARLLPLALGLLAFSYSTPVDFMAYCSRIAVMPTYTTITKALRIFAVHQARLIEAHGRDKLTAGFIQVDNVQNYLRIQDYRIGSVNQMNIGLAATYCVLPGVDPKALSIKDKQDRVKANERARLDVGLLLSLVDTEHLDTVIPLHWLRLLVEMIPQLKHYKGPVSRLFETRCRRVSVPIPEGATPVYPLSSSGKSENVTTELKDAMLDFLSQVGQKEDDYLEQLVMVGGDGLTFQRLLELQRYLQFHSNSRDKLTIVEPVLAPWHTGWTDLNRMHETHYDSNASSDPSTIGHSASLIGRPAPANFKKTDFYPALDTVSTVLDVRMLDCWRIVLGDSTDIFRHFDTLAAKDAIPSLEELEEKAKYLHKTYSTTRAAHMALGDTADSTEWSASIPLGKEWEPMVKDTERREGRHERGDRVLSNSILFMRDALISRELLYAIAQGDAGRVYQIMKYMLFTFAGSTHTKYCTYILEVVTRLELESSQELMDSILKTTLINLTGRPGSAMASDIMQEYFNRLLEAIVEKKGLKYGDPFARNIISPNLAHFARIKLNLRSGAGLARRSGKHSVPSQDPEIRKLSLAYQEHELHKRRPGRVYRDTDKDDFTRGIVKLQSGRLQKWILDTTHFRGLVDEGQLGASEKLGVAGEVDDDDESGGHSAGGLQTFAVAEVIDGEMVVGTFSADDVADSFDEYMTEVDNTDPMDES